MKAVILAGGLGTRLSEYTEHVPKPMVEIGNTPILVHIMDYYSQFGVTDFIIAAGYKSEVIKSFFLNMAVNNSDFKVNTATGDVDTIRAAEIRDWNVSIIDTGQTTMTGGRLLRLKNEIGQGPFFMTYGDGLSDVDLDALLAKHVKSKAIATVTAVRPSARFGALEILDGIVSKFAEKPQTVEGWINGGFFVVEPALLDFISDDASVLEQEPLGLITKLGKFGAHKHEGFWQCMDTKRDKDFLEELWRTGEAPWRNR